MSLLWEFDMGMFDTVHIACPNCDTMNDVQSKGGDCVLAEYHGLDNTPSDVLGGLLLPHRVISCKACLVRYRVRATFETFIPDFQTEFDNWCRDNAYHIPSTTLSYIQQFIDVHSEFPAPAITNTIDSNKNNIIELVWNFGVGKLSVTFDGAPNFIACLDIPAGKFWSAKKTTEPLSDVILSNLIFLDHYHIDDEDLCDKVAYALHTKQPFTLDMNNAPTPQSYLSVIWQECVDANLIFVIN